MWRWEFSAGQSLRLWEEEQKHHNQNKQHVDMESVPRLHKESVPSLQKMTAESRGRILGEKPLERSYKDSSPFIASADAVQFQFNLSDTFTKPASLNDTPERVKPFKADPAKQERFEQFLKEKYQGGLRSTESGGNSKMSESARARERLDFEAAAEAIEKGKQDASNVLFPNQQLAEMSASASLKFTSGGLEEAKVSKVEEQIRSKMYPKRDEYQWRPSPLLCKRFDIVDPYMGKPPPLPRARSRMDSLVFTSDFVKATKSEDTVPASGNSMFVSQPETQVTADEVLNSETEIEINSTNVERPVDLYKAIFSDDSDDEGEGFTSNQMQDPEKKTEVANTTLNRLIAGDFLESLGKELGLEVPSEAPIVRDKVNIASQKENNCTNTSNIPPQKNHIAMEISDVPSKGKEAADGCSSLPKITQKGASNGNEQDHGNRQGEPTATGHFVHIYEKAEAQKLDSEVKISKLKSKRGRSRSSSPSSEHKKSRRHSRRHHRRSSSPSSEDERSTVRSGRRRSRKSQSDSDSSDDQRSRDASRLKVDKKNSSRGKSDRRKHSKNYSRSRNSPSTSSRHRSRGDGSEERKSSRKLADEKRHTFSSYKESRTKHH